jgi:nucleotide-binding universal stress UspA family protein
LQEKTEESVSTRDQQFGLVGESSKSPHVHISFPSFERILVAYDGMQMSKKALSYAAYISKISNSEIIVINVIKANRDLSSKLPITIEANLRGKEEQIEVAERHQGVPLSDVLREVIEEMKSACKASGTKEKVIFEICGGDPADEIISLSNLMHFDLIVMGSRRIASRIGGIGSTTRKVATTSKSPLLIVQKQPRYKDEW